MISDVINEVTNFLVDDAHWKDISRLNENWADDPIFKNYHKLGNKQKGVLGEYFVENYIKSLKGSVVHKPINTGHDRIIDGYKTEVKFSLANSTRGKININKFIINHISIGKDWDRLIFCGINPLGHDAERVRMYYFNKEDFKNYMLQTDKPIFRHQQAGAKGGNDDYICVKFDQFVELPFINPIQMW